MESAGAGPERPAGALVESSWVLAFAPAAGRGRGNGRATGGGFSGRARVAAAAGGGTVGPGSGTDHAGGGGRAFGAIADDPGGAGQQRVGRAGGYFVGKGAGSRFDQRESPLPASGAQERRPRRFELARRAGAHAARSGA